MDMKKHFYDFCCIRWFLSSSQLRSSQKIENGNGSIAISYDTYDSLLFNIANFGEGF